MLDTATQRAIDDCRATVHSKALVAQRIAYTNSILAALYVIEQTRDYHHRSSLSGTLNNRF
jgi:hypothetical protein